MMWKDFTILSFYHFITPSFSKCKRTTVETHCMRLNAGTCEIKHISTRFKNDSTNEHQRCDPRRNPMRSVGYEKQRLIAYRRCRLTFTKGRNIVTDWVASPKLLFFVISLHPVALADAPCTGCFYKWRHSRLYEWNRSLIKWSIKYQRLLLSESKTFDSWFNVFWGLIQCLLRQISKTFEAGIK